MTDKYVEEDNIKVLLTDYSKWLATTSIPKYFNGDIKSNSTLNLNAITLNIYLRKVILMLKDKFPKNCDWVEPEWITRMGGEEFENKSKREQVRGNVEVSEDTKHRIYSKASQCINEIDDKWMSNIDFKQVNLNLTKTA